LDLRFLRIRFRWFSVGSDSVGFLRIGIRLVFQDRDQVGFSSMDLRFFKGSGCFVLRNWIVSFADTKM
jgi:hypothetical protein